MDLSRLTLRQQLKYLEEEARKEKEQVQLQEENKAEAVIGSWTVAILPRQPTTQIRVKVNHPSKSCTSNGNSKDQDMGNDVEDQTKRKKKRRIIEDDDDDDENEMDFGVQEKEVGVTHNKKDPSSPEGDQAKAEKINDRIVGRLKRLQEQKKADHQAAEATAAEAKQGEVEAKVEADNTNNRIASRLKRLQEQKKSKEQGEGVKVAQRKDPSPPQADDKTKADDMKNRIVGRLKRLQEQKKEKELQKKRSVADTATESSSKKPSSTTIPKKSPAGIPRKAVDSTRKEQSSLLAEYKAPRTTSSSTTPSSANGVTTGRTMAPSKKVTIPPKASTDPNRAATNNRESAGPAVFPKPEGSSRSSKPGQDMVVGAGGPIGLGRSTPGETPSSQQLSQRSLTPPPPQASTKSKSTMSMRIIESLSEACSQLSEDKDSKFRLTRRSSSPSSSANFSIDLWASLLTHEEYDFFDADASGQLVLQPKIPIFPEDFPQGKPEWPLSWWGIVDPALVEQRKDQQIGHEKEIDATRSSSSKSKNQEPSMSPNDELNHRPRKRHRGPLPPSSRVDSELRGGEQPPHSREGGGDEFHHRVVNDGPNGGRSGPGPHRGDFRGGGGGRGGHSPYDHRGPPPRGNGPPYPRGPPYPDRGTAMGYPPHRGPPHPDRPPRHPHPLHPPHHRRQPSSENPQRGPTKRDRQRSGSRA